ncbi:MAG TPA: class I SAM-dependent methyltransferase [Methanotrichaceae archaeon]|nr:class I SAM-dependent methyltransferase [Methanotrichaceae archaeon]
MTQEQSVLRESGVHGMRWETLHDNYFSDSEIALPFINAIENVISSSAPSVIADLGGGTGFILRELLKHRDLTGVRLVNVDLSPRQLSACSEDRIATIQASASQITRHQLMGEDGAMLLIARSILHYFGSSGLRPALRHIRGQLLEGEFFIHQSACFQDRVDAECMNLIYERMGTDKWYGTTGDMETALKDEGFELCTVAPAPKIHLSSGDLSERYGLSASRVSSIRSEAERRYGPRREVFVSNGEGFDAWLHLYIFTCRAV